MNLLNSLLFALLLSAVIQIYISNFSNKQLTNSILDDKLSSNFSSETRQPSQSSAKSQNHSSGRSTTESQSSLTQPNDLSSKMASNAIKILSRRVIKRILSHEQAEGVGATVFRSIGSYELRNLDPFLMLDEFRVNSKGGFPDHPHRGFETVTYMLPSSEGIFGHEDFAGHKGILKAGDLQWMTAGRGILHSEMPMNDKLSHGLQLWINLPREHKMMPPRYQELPAKDVPEVTKDGVSARIIAGTALGVTAKVHTINPTHYFHFHMQPNSTLEHQIPPKWTSFLYLLNGEAYVAGESEEDKCDAHQTLVLSDNSEEENGIIVKTKDKACDFVLLASQKINESIVQHGPFVMNSREEIMHAIRDYQEAKNGFEGADVWRSQIASRGGRVY